MGWTGFDSTRCCIISGRVPRAKVSQNVAGWLRDLGELGQSHILNEWRKSNSEK